MIKTRTGRHFTPKEFRLLNQCVRCGIAENIKYGQSCDSCEKQDAPSCKRCETLLRPGITTLYTYDIKADHRDSGIDFKVNKESVREFIYYVASDRTVDEAGVCSRCWGWEGRIKNECFVCGKNFENTVENHRLNGNVCERCDYRCSAVI